MSLLILPNGLAPKTVEPITEREMAWLMVAEDVCRKLNITIACTRCLRAGARTGAVLRGENESRDATLSVECPTCLRRMTFSQRAN